MDTARLDRAMAKLQRIASDNVPMGARISAEIEYGQAYQELVKAGEAPPIRLKYRTRGNARSGGTGNASGNAGTSAGKHMPHPLVFGYRRNGYKCEPKWNPSVAS